MSRSEQYQVYFFVKENNRAQNISGPAIIMVLEAFYIEYFAASIFYIGNSITYLITIVKIIKCNTIPFNVGQPFSSVLPIIFPNNILVIL